MTNSTIVSRIHFLIDRGQSLPIQGPRVEGFCIANSVSSSAEAKRLRNAVVFFRKRTASSSVSMIP
jgi:hypothetical protein